APAPNPVRLPRHQLPRPVRVGERRLGSRLQSCYGLWASDPSRLGNSPRRLVPEVERRNGMSTTDAAYSTQPFRERLNAGILEAYKAAGLVVSVNGSEKPDPGKLAERVYSLLANTRVADAKEIPTKAITRADLAANVFASTPSPGSPDW